MGIVQLRMHARSITKVDVSNVGGVFICDLCLYERNLPTWRAVCRDCVSSGKAQSEFSSVGGRG